MDFKDSITNAIDEPRAEFAGIIGQTPSLHAKSPSIWNPVFEALGSSARYLAFDTPASNLERLVGALREDVRYLGGSVTVPHKMTVMAYLDNVDEMSAQIGAVNTIARQADGTLRGFNTDGQGAIDALRLDFGEGQFFGDLGGAHVVMIGAGGAARATAFFLAREIGESGSLSIANRTHQKALELADAVAAEYGNATSLPISDMMSIAASTDLVVNATSCGQTGRFSNDGSGFLLEPYSPLAPAQPGTVSEDCDEAAAEWLLNSAGDIAENNRASMEIVSQYRGAVFFDVVYSPFETTFLRQARWAGLSTMNGKWMNVAQAADAFANKVCCGMRGERTPTEYYDAVARLMAAVW